jgi:hypothetical protein
MSPNESPYRVPTRSLWILVIVCLMAVLVACGGGGSVGIAGVGSGGTGASFSGPISGFGSIIVNGVRIDDSGASITLDDDQTGGSEVDLKLGMMVEVEGDRDASGATGKASRIWARSFVQGPVAAIDTAANRLTVLGVTVTVSSRTVFDGAGVTGLGALRANDTVEIHGIRDTSGGLKATRIERMPATSDVRLTGIVQSAGASAFTIKDVTVQYQPADLVNLPNGVSAGALVRVKGALSGNTIDAASVRQERLTPAVKDRQHVEVEGVVNSLSSTSSFEVNGMPVMVADGAKVEGSVALGERVEVKGQIENDILVASTVEANNDDAEQKEDAFELHGPIVSLDPAARTFTMRKGAVTVAWDGNTRFDKAFPGAGAGLATGLKVNVKGKMKGNVLVATKVEMDD